MAHSQPLLHIQTVSPAGHSPYFVSAPGWLNLFQMIAKGLAASCPRVLWYVPQFLTRVHLSISFTATFRCCPTCTAGIVLYSLENLPGEETTTQPLFGLQFLNQSQIKTHLHTQTIDVGK